MCYGIGDIIESQTSQQQLALLSLLQQKYSSTTYVYDPILFFKDTDIIIETLKQLNIILIDKNEECKRRSVKNTLYFMPHCSRAMYNNVLYANWNLECLSRIVLFGNR